MAFSVLNEEEILLLTDEQRTQYERELKQYQQRAAFVEYLEEMENRHIEAYEPVLQPIPMIGSTNFRPYERTEYPMTICEPIQKPEAYRNVFEAPEAAELVLPKTAIPEIQTVTIQIAERKPSGLPKVAGPELKNINPIKAIVQTEPSLPRLSIGWQKTAGFAEPEVPKMEVPAVDSPRLDRCKFEKPASLLPVLPERPEIRPVTQIAFEKTKPQPNNLPIIASPCVELRSIRLEKNEKPDIPEMGQIRMEQRAYNPPANSGVELPVYSKPEVKSRTVVKPDHAKKELPAVDLSWSERMVSVIKPTSVIETAHANKELPAVDLSWSEHMMSGIKSISMTEANHASKELPAVDLSWSKHMISVRKPISAAEPKHEKKELPAIDMTWLNDRILTMKPIEREREWSDTYPPSVPQIMVKKYEKTECEISDLPKIKIEAVPDAYAVLENLLAEYQGERDKANEK
ncbi:MAG: hypothetical protein IJ567_07815 [Lachnospiraceae bacterium]|nr:hypothetical protein [Lachnospiraceae bacterium]